jgi:hypothetical protein
MHKQLTQSKNLNKSKNPSPKTLTHKKVSIFFFFKMVSKTRLIVSDFIVSIIWVWNGALIKMFVFKVLQMGHDSRGEFMRQSLTVVSLFFFAFLAKVTKGASFNPLAVLSSAISGDFSQFLFTIGTRIPAQVCFSFPLGC